VLGVDGPHVDPRSLDIAAEQFVAHDLTVPLDLGRKFDLAMSLEVAEHIDQQYAETFVQSLCGLSDVILFSAAIPGQGGTHHVNESWPTYWSGLFAGKGFVPVDCLRRLIWDDTEVEHWYAQNIHFYVRQSALAQHPRLAQEHAAAGGKVLSLVHPKTYEQIIEWAVAQHDA
jgi:hypothetical protein